MKTEATLSRDRPTDGTDGYSTAFRGLTRAHTHTFSGGGFLPSGASGDSEGLAGKVRDDLEEAGFSPAQIERIGQIVGRGDRERALSYAAELLHRIFLRLDRDSPNGRALARALGATSDASLIRAAAAFCVTKQYLYKLQRQIEAKLGDLIWGLRPSHGSSRENLPLEVKSRP